MRLREEGAEVTIAAPKGGTTYAGKTNSLSAKSDVSFDDVNPVDFDALCIPGGWAPDYIRRSEAVKNMVRKFHEDGKIIGMICHAGLVGISAGILKGRKATGSLGIKDDILNAGGVWVDEPAFIDRTLVWGRVVEDIPAYCRALVSALESWKNA